MKKYLIIALIILFPLMSYWVEYTYIDSLTRTWVYKKLEELPPYQWADYTYASNPSRQNCVLSDYAITTEKYIKEKWEWITYNCISKEASDKISEEKQIKKEIEESKQKEKDSLANALADEKSKEFAQKKRIEATTCPEWQYYNTQFSQCLPKPTTLIVDTPKKEVKPIEAIKTIESIQPVKLSLKEIRKKKMEELRKKRATRKI